MKQTACMWSQTVTTVNISVPHFQSHTLCTLASTCVSVVSPHGKTTPMHARSAWGMIWIRIPGMGVSWRWVVTIPLVSELLWEVEYDGPSLNPFCFSGKKFTFFFVSFFGRMECIAWVCMWTAHVQQAHVWTLTLCFWTDGIRSLSLHVNCTCKPWPFVCCLKMVSC